MFKLLIEQASLLKRDLCKESLFQNSTETIKLCIQLKLNCQFSAHLNNFIGHIKIKEEIKLIQHQQKSIPDVCHMCCFIEIICFVFLLVQHIFLSSPHPFPTIVNIYISTYRHFSVLFHSIIILIHQYQFANIFRGER